jgi:MoaA/NifB/PqqE/SkfB family radical SAM enzyme
MNINGFMEQGISSAVKTAARFYLSGKAGRSFIAGLGPEMQKNAFIRERYEREGVHVPAFLIASIASRCNLHCAGCYARASGTCASDDAVPELNTEQWEEIFREAAALGVSFILLAGGEPLLRSDIIRTAARCQSIVFPIFTNGTMIDDTYLTLFDENRNLIPVLSIEGNAEETDRRRGTGVSENIDAVIKQLSRRKILFGVSITVTNQNREEVTISEFVKKLRDRGCGLAFYVEYVPAESGTEHLVLSEAECRALNERMLALRKAFSNMIILSFPGDEEKMGGCLAAGRGFFHINPSGGAEPCPFAPFAKFSLRDRSMLDVLKSDYFQRLQELEMNAQSHTGGCTLFALKEQVQELAAQ